MEVLHRTVRQQQPMLKIKICPCLRRAGDNLLHEFSVFGMNSLERQVQCRFNRPIVCEDSKRFGRPVDLTAGNIPAKTACVAQYLRFGQVNFTSPQLLFRSLAVVNVRKQVIPTDDAAFTVTQRQGARMEPAVHAVSTAETVIKVVRMTSFDRVPPCGERGRNVIRRNDIRRFPAF